MTVPGTSSSCRCGQRLQVHDRQGGPCTWHGCTCLGYDPVQPSRKWPTAATLHRRHVLEYVELHPGSHVGTVGAALGIEREWVRSILLLLVEKSLVRTVGPEEGPAYYSRRLPLGFPDPLLHYQRHVAPYAPILRLLERVHQAETHDLARALHWPLRRAERLLALAQLEGAVRLGVSPFDSRARLAALA